MHPILLILLHESGLSPLKTLGTASSVQIINMHGNQYLFGREERMFEEEHTDRVEASSGVLFHNIHLFSFYPPSTTHVHMYNVWARKHVHIRKYIHSVLSLCPRGPLQCVIASVTVYLSICIDNGCMGVTWDVFGH